MDLNRHTFVGAVKKRNSVGADDNVVSPLGEITHSYSFLDASAGQDTCACALTVVLLTSYQA